MAQSLQTALEEGRIETAPQATRCRPNHLIGYEHRSRAHPPAPSPQPTGAPCTTDGTSPPTAHRSSPTREADGCCASTRGCVQPNTRPPQCHRPWLGGSSVVLAVHSEEMVGSARANEKEFP